MALNDPIGRFQRAALALLAVGMTVTVGTALEPSGLAVLGGVG